MKNLPSIIEELVEKKYPDERVPRSQPLGRSIFEETRKEYADSLQEAYKAGRKEALEKIRDYIVEVHGKGFELQTVIEHLDNEFIVEDLLKEESK